METVYVGVGSNLGDTFSNCMRAIEEIKLDPFCSTGALSPFYRTEPVGVSGQNWYMNAVLTVYTTHEPRDLIASLLAIEKKMGRKRTGIRWDSRVIDLDILLYGNAIINDISVTVPHPRMHKRRFVMAPMADLAPDLIHPTLGKTMSEILNDIPETDQQVKRMEKN